MCRDCLVTQVMQRLKISFNKRTLWITEHNLWDVYPRNNGNNNFILVFTLDTTILLDLHSNKQSRFWFYSSGRPLHLDESELTFLPPLSE